MGELGELWYINYMITCHMICGIYIEMEQGASSQTVG